MLPAPLFKLPSFLKLTNTDPFAAWFVVTGDATPDGIRVVRSVLGAISSLPIVVGDKMSRALREEREFFIDNLMVRSHLIFVMI